MRRLEEGPGEPGTICPNPTSGLFFATSALATDGDGCQRTEGTPPLMTSRTQGYVGNVATRKLPSLSQGTREKWGPAGSLTTALQRTPKGVPWLGGKNLPCWTSPLPVSDTESARNSARGPRNGIPRGGRVLSLSTSTQEEQGAHPRPAHPSQRPWRTCTHFTLYSFS